MSALRDVADIAVRANNTMCSEVMLDPRRMQLDSDGVKSFCWPVHRNELIGVRDAFLDTLIETLRERRRRGDEDTFVVEVLALHWTVSVLRLYQSWSAYRRLNESGIAIQNPPEACLMRALARGVKPSMESYVGVLHDGPPPVNPWLAPARQLRGLWIRDGISRRGSSRVDFQSDIVTIALGPLIYQHARRIDECVTYLAPATWFGRLGDQSSNRSESVLPNVAVDLAQESFRQGGETLPHFAAEWLRAVFTKSTSHAAIHLRTATVNPGKVPRRLWTGTAGNLWARLLRRVVKDVGGTVTGHDHGSGMGRHFSRGSTLANFLDCDRFVTSTGCMTSLRGSAVRDVLVEPVIPEFLSLPALDAAPVRSNGISRVSKNSPETTVMLLPMGCEGDQPHFIGCPVDIVKVDWTARLVARFREWGYRVLLKPHPEFPGPPSEVFLTQFGTTVIEQPFEDVFHEADIVVFSTLYTSTFPVALRSDKSVVLLDLELEPWVTDARELLELRCAIVAAGYAADNRIELNWDQLRDALERSRHLRDRTFVETHLEGIRTAERTG